MTEGFYSHYTIHHNWIQILNHSNLSEISQNWNFFVSEWSRSYVVLAQDRKWNISNKIEITISKA